MRDARGSVPLVRRAANRLFFPAGIVFKGSGFYKTDSRGASSSSITSDGGDSGLRQLPQDGQRRVRDSKSDTRNRRSSDTPATSRKAASTDSAG